MQDFAYRIDVSGKNIQFCGFRLLDRRVWKVSFADFAYRIDVSKEIVQFSGTPIRAC